MTNPIQQALEAQKAKQADGAAEASAELPTSPALVPKDAKQPEPVKGDAQEFPDAGSARTVDSKGPGTPINDKRYICHTAPSTFVFRDRTRFTSPDGIIYASTVAQEAELQAAVRCGNLSVYDGTAFKTSEQTPAR